MSNFKTQFQLIVDGNQDQQSTIDSIELLLHRDGLEENNRNHLYENQGYSSFNETVIHIGKIQYSDLKHRTAQEFNESKNITSIINTKKNFIEDKIFNEDDVITIQSDDDEVFILENFQEKKCLKTINKYLGEGISHQFQIIFKQFQSKHIDEKNCFEMLWEEFRDQNVHLDVIKAAYILLNITTFQPNTIQKQISILCLQLKDKRSDKFRKLKNFIIDISNGFNIKILSNN